MLYSIYTSPNPTQARIAYRW